MRRLFRAALAAMTLAIAGPAMPSLAQTPPNVLIVGQIAEPQSLDPHTVTATNDFRILVNIYDGLVRYKDGTLEVEPALAESWTISDDGKTYRFKLRQGVKFQRRSSEVQLRPHVEGGSPILQHRAVPALLQFLVD
jgi:peptide/nickel transport system substrate-binding protein